MSADNNPFMKREIQALRDEEPRPDAKAELILALQRERRESRMSILKKATLPTLVSIAAIAGVFYVSQPKVMAATPDRVLKAIQDIKNYTIKSFVVDGDKRHLQSKTTVNGKDRKTVAYDANGAETNANMVGNMFVISDPTKMGFKLNGNGNLENMSKEDIDKMKASFHIITDVNDKNGVKIQVEKGPDGKKVERYFVNGKEVDKLPAELEGKVQILGDKAVDGKNVIKITQGKDGASKHVFVNGKAIENIPNVDIQLKSIDAKKIEVKVTKDANGKEVKKFIVDGKEVDKLPEGVAPMVNFGKVGTKGGSTVIVNGKELKGSGSASVTKSMAIMGGDGGEMMTMTSGQTSADYLMNLLKDTTKWTIERGVTYNGQTLDKFTLKGPISPIVLYVDPATALPKILRFETPFQEGTIIEDVYEYSVQP